MICCKYFKVLKVVWCGSGFLVFKLSIVVDILAFFTWWLFGLFFKKFGKFIFLSSGHSANKHHTPMSWRVCTRQPFKAEPNL